LKPRLRWRAALAGSLVLAGGLWWWQDSDVPQFLTAEPSAFAAQFAMPSPPDSTATRRELDELLEIQRTRTPQQVAAARADRKTRIERFYGALGLDPASAPELPKLSRLAERVEDDVRIQVRGAKEHFRRLRPFEIEPRLEPCIDKVRGDLSYPSGHSAYGWAMAGLLMIMVPEKADAIRQRGEEFARQRMVCGVHFASDLEAGRLAAAKLLDDMRKVPEFRAEFDEARKELRTALGLAR
jgi:acid phosphatase (class A)